MGRIRVLTDLVINKIAAGEVIERPASVVKELLENAVDAGATSIALDIEEGGRKLIRVADDGMGMSAEDLALAVTRHATSKIASEEDLFSVASLGFRGEALPSIGSVTHLTITSRLPESVEGHSIQVAGDRIEPVTPIGRPPGTTVEVRDLFFNVPARRKFLKTVNTELGHVTEQFSRIAIAHPNLHLALAHNGRELHRLTATESRLTRIGNFYGEEIISQLVPVDRAEDGLEIHGHVILPSYSRASGKWQYTFVNGRYVRDRFVMHAVSEAYRGLIDSNRRPAFFLFINIAPDVVDVNVHPTKVEVRWRNSGQIHSQVLSLLREAFLQHDLTPAAESGDLVDDQAEQRRSAIRQAMADFFKKEAESQRAFDFQPRQYKPRRIPADSLLPKDSGPSGHRPPASPAPKGGPVETAPPERPTEPTAAPTEPVNDEEPAAKAIQLHNCYLVTETADGMVIIDQHALHERVLYETFRDRLARGPLESQRLLIPETVNVTAEQIAAADAHVDLLKDLGIEVGEFGAGVLGVHAFPVLLQDKVDAASFTRDLLDKLVEAAEQPSRETMIHEVLDMMACKAAVKAGDPLTPEEIQALLAYREQVERSSNCPHGRPTSLRFSLKDLEKQFHRT